MDESPRRPPAHRTRPARILLLGPAPPPYGGLQTLGLRMTAWLQRTGREARLIDLAHESGSRQAVHRKDVQPCGDSLPSIARQIALFRPDLVHALLPGWRPTLALVTLAEMARHRRMPHVRTVVTLSGDTMFDGVPVVARPALFAAWRRLDHVIAQDDAILGWLQRQAGVSPHRSSCIRGYLPPGHDELDPATLPGNLRHFLEQHHPVLVAGGAIASWLGADRTGVDGLIEAARRLRREYPKLGVVYAITVVQDRDRMQALRAELARAGLQDTFQFVSELPSFVALVARADVYVRAHVLDNDSPAVREALSLGVPVVASDVAPRPPGCEQFAPGDPDSLMSALRAALVRPRWSPDDQSGDPGAGSELLYLYDRLLAEQSSSFDEPAGT